YLYRVLPDISRLRIEHNQNSIFLEVFIPEIDLILGGDQEKIKEIVSEIKSRLNHEKIKLSLRLREIKNVYADAQTIANMIASQIKQQMPVMLILRNMIKKILPERKKGVEGGEIIISGIIDKSGISQTKKRSNKKENVAKYEKLITELKNLVGQENITEIQEEN
ncbi:35282_t:CDS:2, partial [Gigaspora margarita]